LAGLGFSLEMRRSLAPITVPKPSMVRLTMSRAKRSHTISRASSSVIPPGFVSTKYR